MASEVIHTIAESGGDYTSIAAWEAAQQRNLVSADEVAIAECETGDDAAGSWAIDGWTVDETRYPHIRNASGHHHGGDRTAGWRCTYSSSNCRPISDYIRIEGIVILPTNNRPGIVIDAGDFTRVFNCVIYGGGTNTDNGIAVTSTGGTKYIYNNIIYGFKGASSGRGIYCTKSGSTATIHVYNNTIADCWRGLQRNADQTVRPKNNLIQDCSDACFSGTFTDTEANISEDATSPNSALRNIAVAFVDEPNDDYHLDESDTDAVDAGVDLSADADLAFSTDFEGDSRPDGEWDIGADEIAAPSAPSVPFLLYERRRRRRR